MLVTGAGGQLGRALAEEFADDGVVAVTRELWDVTLPPPPLLAPGDLVLHAAAWTDVDGAEDDPQGAAAVNVGGTANVAALGAPLVYYSTDYVFDGRKREPYVESDGPNPQSAYGRSKLHGEAAAGEQAWIVRTSWLFGPTGQQLRPDDAASGSGAGRGVGRRRPARLADLRRPSRGRHPAGAPSCRTASTTSPPRATRPGPTSRRRSSRRPGSTRACGGSTTAELDPPRKAQRPAYSVLRSEKGAPELPHWREGLRECVAAIRAGGEGE